jgi:SEC-C motif-containing protein
MKSRYSAYAAGEADYIIDTTHPEHPEYREERTAWREEILAFSRQTEFLGLEILAHHHDSTEGWVHFIAHLSSGPMEECSRFLLTDRWLYHSAYAGHPCPASGTSTEIE